MSSPIWTPAALQSEVQPIDSTAWRLVEAQHVVSTLSLVDSLEEQAMLEDILETTKPPLPKDCQGLDYLLATPFRYRPYPHGSRFRRAGLTKGVWYGSEAPETALAEMVFYRFLFYAESPNTPFPDNPADYTAFSAALSSERALDLTTGGLKADAADWQHHTDYTSCQNIADTAREIDVGILRFASVRDPSKGANFAVLDCRAFRNSAPLDRQTWRIRISRTGAQAVRDYPRLGLEFPQTAFNDDPRVAGMVWER
ncbi:RES family NAD+ phosphorylase [Falsihalocynthiibacter sp. BN13B15]|uniref:RES family NAD+ phosphorylase n=1 Tax=Falsihalocynthiibacter sp. BN13B15 TaxID=3240871 RepID=UPI003510013C